MSSTSVPGAWLTRLITTILLWSPIPLDLVIQLCKPFGCQASIEKHLTKRLKMATRKTGSRQEIPLSWSSSNTSSSCEMSAHDGTWYTIYSTDSERCAQYCDSFLWFTKLTHLNRPLTTFSLLLNMTILQNTKYHLPSGSQCKMWRLFWM